MNTSGKTGNAFPFLSWLLRSDGFDGDDPALATAFAEANDAGHPREEGVVLPAADVDTREKTRPALAHEDRASRHDLSRELLDPEPLGVRVATVARRALSLLVCHEIYPSIESIRISSIVWRCPLVRRYCFRIFFLNTRILRLRTSRRTVALTETPERSSFA